MKRFFPILGIALVAALSFSCTKDDKGIKTVTATVQVDESALAENAPKPENYQVALVNIATGASVSGSTENGSFTATGLVPGSYTVTATATATDGGSVYSFAGSVNQASIVEDGTTVKVAIASSKESALILKEIYHTGTVWGMTDPKDVWSGTTYFRDQFYEIYNNSTETVYADGIAFAATVYANFNYSVIYEWDIPDADQYVFAQEIWQIGGSGTDYPVKPGESFVVAQWATDHNAAILTDGHSIDLSGAEFEGIEEEKILWNATITDGPAINMTFVVNATGYTPQQWMPSTYNAAFVMFKPGKPLVNENFISDVNGSTSAREIPITDVLDATQWKEYETDGDKLHLPSVLDAGFTVQKAYEGKSIIRKVKETRADGTIVYQDTNNSTNDFEVTDGPKVRRNGEGVPAWNTWRK